MKKINLAFAISFTIISFLVGLVEGYYISPTYQQIMYEKNDMNLGAPDRFVDLRYLNAMASHHRGAMLLADQVVETSHRTEIRNLAHEIRQNEPKLIEELYAWKREWYNDGRKVKDPVVPNLGGSDEKIDLRFLNALIAHHEAGIAMTKEIRSKSSNTTILNNADAVELFLSGSLTTLKTWRNEWFSVN